MSLRERLVTTDEFELFLARAENAGRNFELIDGAIIEKMPSQLHGRIVALLILEIGLILRRFRIGYVETEVRYQSPGDPHNARQPDLSVMLDTQTPPLPRGAVPRLPDIAIEVKSPDDTYKAMRERAAYFIAHGVLLVWLVFPEKWLVEVYRPDADIEVLDRDDVLGGYGLLPEFDLPVRAIFDMGALSEGD